MDIPTSPAPFVPTPAPMTSPMSPPPMALQPMPQKGMSPWIAVGIAAVVIVAYVAFAAYAGMWPFSSTAAPYASPTPTASVNPLPSSSATPDTTGWKSYTNTQYGFSVKLPPSWDDYSTGPVSFAIDNGDIVSGVLFATPCTSSVPHEEPFSHFTINFFPVADYERLRAKSQAEDSPFPVTEIARNATYVYTYTYAQDACSSSAWVAAHDDYRNVLSTFKLTVR